ncbi:MAG: DNA repair protein RecO [Pseudomonadota bacterium]
MEWRDAAILLAVRRHGETSVIIDTLTQAHGRCAGVVRGGTSRKIAPHLQPGAQLDVTWKARLEDHLGSFTIEPVRSRAGAVMQDRLALAGLQAVTSVLTRVLAEREPMEDQYHAAATLLDLMIATPAWPLAYLRWEVALLDALGYGLDLTACAVTGVRDGLVYISPKSGRAVSAQGAGDWADRLLPLPPCLLPGGEGSDADIAAALHTTGVFLEKAAGDRGLPDARRRLIDALARQSS